jgi:D-glycero-alpha-D-manno-heptose-7-phosphate kinase
MIANTEAQARLHPELVSADARQVIEIARQYHASGWKVNGAGGEGGSLTLLGSPRPDQRHRMVETIQKISPLYRLIPIQLDHWGLRVWETKSE